MELIKKQFWRNVLPSMAAFAFSGLYTIVDGFFVGQNIGDNGLAAINIAYPVTAFVGAVGTGIGMAGAIWIAISTGKEEEDQKNLYLGNTLSLILIFSALITALLFISYIPLLRLFGAHGTILEYAASYLRIIILGTAFQLCSVGLLPLLRNFNGALTAMAAMISGFVTNIVLDWYFTSVLKQGTAGAALATIIGQAVSLIPCIYFVLKNRGLFSGAEFRLQWKYAGKICSAALSPFGAVLSPMLITIIINKASLTYGGDQPVACYAVISYVISVVYLLLQGIGDGVQPLVGKCYGANEKKPLHLLKRMAFFLSLTTALCCALVLLLSRTMIPRFFGASEAVSLLYSNVLLYFLSGLPCIAVSKVAVSYFYATDKVKKAYLMIYCEPVLLAAAAGFLFPAFLGIKGVWLAVPSVQLIMAGAGLLFLRPGRNKLKID